MRIAASSPALRQRLISSLGRISLVIALTESLIMLSLATIRRFGAELAAWQETVLDSSLLVLIGAPLLWFLTLRPLARENEREQAHAKLGEVQFARLKQAMDACNDMILVTDQKGTIHYVNPSLCRFSGWTETDLTGRAPDVLDSPNADRETLADMQETLRQGGNWSGRLLNRRKGSAPIRIAGQADPPDPKEWWAEMSITPIRGENGERLGYVQIQRDISEQVAREAALSMERADADARLRIAELLQEDRPLRERSIQVLDILFGLAAFGLQRKGGMFLRKPDEDCLELFALRGQFSEEFVSKEQRVPLHSCLCGRAAASGELLVSDDCFCDPRHEHRFENMEAHGHYIVPLVSAGDILGVMFLYTDPYPARNQARLAMLRHVGEMLALAVLKEQAKSSLEAARDAALEAARTKSAFLANMSHEIRTPMNGVIGMLELLKDTELSREQWDLLETAANSAESLLDILNEILDFSKLEAGKIEIEQASFDLASLVEEVCALSAVRAHHKRLELNCLYSPTLPRMWRGDPTRIRQTLANLVGNAVKFTETGEVSVRVTRAASASSLRFEIRDTGIGISKEAQARLFQAFTQADESTARRFGGTGLGLSISKSLIELMGGEMGLESEPGAGARFWFVLPLLPEEKAAPAPNLDFSGRRALVVDDNETNRFILKHYLEHWGFFVSEADRGAAALAELEAAHRRGEAYDLALLDRHMPEMDGLALARRMNDDPDLRALPRILLSSGGIADSTERGKSGIARSLSKPVRQSLLFEAIAETFAGENGKASGASRAFAAKLPGYSGKRVLAAEDNRVNQKVLTAMLAKFGIVPQIVENGQAALDRLSRERFDLALMDCQMPVLDGYAATRALRAQEFEAGAPRVPIVALTAHATAGEREKCLVAGMDDYLSKPVTRERLAEALARWLGDPGDNSASAHENCHGRDEESLSPPVSLWDNKIALAALYDDEELLKEMIALFIGETPSHIAALRAAQERCDLSGLADAAHALKGMAGHFCAQPLKTLAAGLETNARSGAPADYARQTEALANAANALSEELGRWKKD
jgi:PAS domain S-box-containing protein